MAHLTLVVGGVRSGKSRFAEQLAVVHPPVIYLATADPAPPDPDAEMADRIARHRSRRAQYTPPWRTVEEPWDLPGALLAHAAAGCLLVDCLTLWVTNLLLGVAGHSGLLDDDILAAVTRLAETGRQ